MSQEDIELASIRERDYLGSSCPECGALYLQEYLDTRIVCICCSSIFERFMTKRQLLERTQCDDIVSETEG
jgi:hypothetical protein